jgi:hypothetical protein
VPNNSLQPTVTPLRGLPAAKLRRYTAFVNKEASSERIIYI